MMYDVGIAGKWLAMLREIAPRLARAALVAGPRTTAYDYFVRNAEVAGSSLGIEIVPTPVADAADIERGIESFSRVANGGLVLPSDSTPARSAGVVGAARRKGGSGNRGRPVTGEGSGLNAAKGRRMVRQRCLLRTVLA
jgi:hypothetical protein